MWVGVLPPDLHHLWIVSEGVQTYKKFFVGYLPSLSLTLKMLVISSPPVQNRKEMYRMKGTKNCVLLDHLCPRLSLEIPPVNKDRDALTLHFQKT